jgi:hypothetical protein
MVSSLAFLAVLLTTASADPASAHPEPAAATLSGRVTTPDGLGLPDVRIEVGEIYRSTSTDADGRYRIPQLPTGTYASLTLGSASLRRSGG